MYSVDICACLWLSFAISVPLLWNVKCRNISSFLLLSSSLIGHVIECMTHLYFIESILFEIYIWTYKQQVIYIFVLLFCLNVNSLFCTKKINVLQGTCSPESRSDRPCGVWKMLSLTTTQGQGLQGIRYVRIFTPTGIQSLFFPCNRCDCFL